ncbi:MULTISPECIES: hypothetical protein [unclassified Streptomyces]|uniref:hypothetical protein n=1 Tax=unclassified Streptomyces TaxID=2593676 RepID=UPI000AA9CDFC|nr:hypothetical protein [Streptomyces sp. CB01883]
MLRLEEFPSIADVAVLSVHVNDEAVPKTAEPRWRNGVDQSRRMTQLRSDIAGRGRH